MRFRRGRVEIAEDAGWKADPAAARAIVAAVTFPLRWRYGYGGVRLAGPGRRRRSAGRGQPGAADPESAAGGACPGQGLLPRLDVAHVALVEGPGSDQPQVLRP